MILTERNNLEKSKYTGTAEIAMHTSHLIPLRNGFCHQYNEKLDVERIRPPPPEYLKLICSFVLLFFFSMMNSLGVVIAHDSFPNRTAYPPLPDFFDWLPYYPNAFQVSEYIVVLLIAGMALLVILHKHRIIILRRIFLIYGVILFLRSFALVSTSIPMSKKDMICDPVQKNTVMNLLAQAIMVSIHGGLSIQGVRTCGDFMFSGHTVFLTLACLFITKYTSSHYRLLPIACWLSLITAASLIITSRSHYTMDVLIAFYITTFLFQYYHALLDSRIRDTWLPFFRFFEGEGSVLIENSVDCSWLPVAWLLLRGSRIVRGCRKLSGNVGAGMDSNEWPI